MTKDINSNAQNMGGPSFHPEMPAKKAASVSKTEKTKTDGAILKEDQVPPL